MLRNCNHICIEGVIGVGKTSLTTLLAQHIGARTVHENVEENPFLAKFYKSRKTYAFQTQLWFLLTRYRQLTEEFVQQDLFHGMVVADYMLAKDQIFASINLDENELALYNRIEKLLEKDVPKPDLVIYLQASTDVLVRRIEKRKRSFESGIERQYLEQINEAYNQFFFHYSDSAVLIVNTDELDFVADHSDFEAIIEQIYKVRGGGVHFYQPPRSADRLRLGKQSS